MNRRLFLSIVVVVLAGSFSYGEAWRGLHVMVSSDADLQQLGKQVPKLAGVGLNVLVVEVDYNFQFTSHPEVGNRHGISKAGAAALAEVCKGQHVRVIPQINCLGHQSWAANTGALLKSHPEFDETPGEYPNNKGIYCRSWCPQHSDVNKVVFDLMDELIDAFSADAFHVGMDEVFLIGSEHCPRCKGKQPAELFAKAVNDYHQHLVVERKVEMLMWADRLIDGKTTGYGKWEGSENGTFGAIDRIPKDIILCDWHYEKRDAYPSIPLFLEKGFRVWPAGWHKVPAVEALVDFAVTRQNERMLGYLSTTWGKVPIAKVAEFPATVAAFKKLPK